MIDTAWNGKTADYISVPGNYGTVPYSELAMHTRQAGKTITRFAIWYKNGLLNWVHIQTDSENYYTDGLPSELMPYSLRTQLESKPLRALCITADGIKKGTLIGNDLYA